MKVLTLKIKTSAHSHKQHTFWNWNSKTNSSYTPETMPPNPETRRSNMSATASWSLWKWHQIYRLLPIHTGNVLLYFGSDIQSQTKARVLKPKNPILKVTLLKINRLLPMAAINMHMKFEIEIPKQTWLTLPKPCHLLMDGQMDKVIPVYPPPASLGGGIMKLHVKP